MNKGGIRNFAKNTLKSMGVNASEETLTEVANIAYDTIANGEISKWEQSIEKYMSQGLSRSEAESRTASEMITQVFAAGAAGAFIGAGFSGMTAAMNRLGKSADVEGFTERAKKSAEEGKGLSRYGEETEYMGMEIYESEDKKSGVAVKKDGEIGAWYNLGERRDEEIIGEAVQRGGKKIAERDGLYRASGFVAEAVSRGRGKERETES